MPAAGQKPNSAAAPSQQAQRADGIVNFVNNL
jgi:hypothetical protein